MKHVFVYWNLHKQMWSVRDQATKKVILHLPSMILQNCAFKVSEAGRRRVIREGRKNVHAGIIGDLIEATLSSTDKEGKPIYYNPYKQSTFTCNGEAVDHVDTVRFYPDKTVFAGESYGH
jgi:hypothetical protein